jgi:hypothetical protein
MKLKFWKFWTINVLVVVALLLGQYYFGAVAFVLANDATYLSLLIVAMFAFATVKIGLEYWKTWRGKPTDPNHTMLWFIAESVVALGLLGTLMGFIILFWGMFGPGVVLDPTNAVMMGEAMKVIASGMATALLTTLAGISTSQIIKLQLVILEE